MRSKIKSFLVGIGLFILSLVLFSPLFIWGVIETIISLFYKKRFIKGLSIFGNVFLSLAYILDILINVILAVPLNRVFVDESNPNHYRFGSKYDTISFALGMNIIRKTESKKGNKFCLFLNRLDEDHCINAVYKKQQL